MTIVDDTYVPPCATRPDVFRSHDADDVTADRRAAHRECAACPMLVDCLYRAVVEVDVSGFVACTTEVDRAHLRDVLGIEVQQQAGVIGAPRVGAGPVDHESILAARHAFPHDTCHQLADRLGCSTSTIKRHLRRAREAKAVEVVAAQRAVPTIDEVLDAFDGLPHSSAA